LRQKTNETAYAFGQQVDLLTMKLYDSIIEGETYQIEYKRAFQLLIQKQALTNFQNGLRNDIKILVRSQKYTTLQEAIAVASAEEKLNGPTSSKFNNYTGKPKNEVKNLRSGNTMQCFKCGRNGHIGRDCRSSKYALPKPEQPARVNAINKTCTYCKKNRHMREECWTLNGKPNVTKANYKNNYKDTRSHTSTRQKTRNQRTKRTTPRAIVARANKRKGEIRNRDLP